MTTLEFIARLIELVRWPIVVILGGFAFSQLLTLVGRIIEKEKEK